jgi:hypothetical protein
MTGHVSLDIAYSEYTGTLLAIRTDVLCDMGIAFCVIGDFYAVEVAEDGCCRYETLEDCAIRGDIMRGRETETDVFCRVDSNESNYWDKVVQIDRMLSQPQ